jgi:formylmethanofuran dehydrogenase subunit E
VEDFQTLLDAAVKFHGHLCIGQVLGVRLAMYGLKVLGLDPVADRKRIIVFVEIDRCAADAISVVARVSLGKRSLKYQDYGKMAATFLDLQSGRAVRLAIRESARDEVAAYAPPGLEHGDAQLIAYQHMPDEKLMTLREVRVELSEYDLPGRPLREIVCERCGENIMDGREELVHGAVLCRACAGEPYYAVIDG